MGRSAGLALGAALVALCSWAAAEGIVLTNQAGRMPAFTDAGRVEVLQSILLPDEPAERASFQDDYWRELKTLRTRKWVMLDCGRGLLALGSTGLTAILMLRLWDVRNLARIRTPRSTRSFLLLGVLAWSALVPAEWARLIGIMGRGYLPYWADSVGLPALAWAFVVLTPLPVVVGLVWLVVLRRARLPTGLWRWDRARQVRSVVWSIACGVLMAPFAALLVGAVQDGRFLMVPLAAVLIYLVFSARAAVLSDAGAPAEKPAR